MKAFRIIQIILLVTLVGYLFWLNTFPSNNWIYLPLLFSVPAGIVLGVALVMGWLLGWFGGRTALWTKSREIKKLQKRISELEHQTTAMRVVTPENKDATPVIPDRSGNFQADSEFENI